MFKLFLMLRCLTILKIQCILRNADILMNTFPLTVFMVKYYF